MPFFLDRFPVEILHSIFDYFWAHEILSLFRNMTDYLDRVLLNYNKYSINFESIRKSQFDLVCRHIQPDQVISLILSDKMETPNQSQLFRSLFSIEQFTRLRALKLIELDDDGKSFFSDLYKVQHLISLEIDVKIKLPFVENAPPLQRLIINISSGVHFDLGQSITTMPFYQLRQLTLSNCSCTQLREIFRRAPRLTSLSISFTFLNPREIDILANLHQGQLSPLALVSLALFIDAPGQTISRNHLEQFLAPLQCLRRLELVISSGAERKFLDANRWELFIVDHLPRLLTFNFKFFCPNIIDRHVLDQFRSPFWLDERRRWFVACDSSFSFLFTVPYFAPTSINHSFAPVPSDLTTLPIEQHAVFYDRVTELRFDSGRWILPYRYNHVKKLILDGPYIHEHVVDLSKIQSFIVNTSEWSLYMIVTLIKEEMPSINYLSLNCTYRGMQYHHFPNISLEQVRVLCMPQYGKSPTNDRFNWSRLFPCVERLIISIDQKRQIPFLIDRFKNMISGLFYIDPCQIDANRRIQVSRQWLIKHTYRLGGKHSKNFICQINDQYLFSLYIWIGEDYESDQQMPTARGSHWWRKCSLWRSVK